MSVEALNGQLATARTLTEHTFDSGITVKIAKVSPQLIDDIKVANPPPPPPMVEVPTFDGTGKKLEPNPHDPDYIEAVARHELELDARTYRLYIKRGVITEIDKDALEELRADLEAAGIPRDKQEPDDHILYVTRIVISTTEDRNDLNYLLTRRNRPTAQAIKEHL